MSGELTFKERFQRATQSFQSYLRRDRGFVARTEFWVYLPGTSLPAQEEMMDRMMQGNPLAVRGISPIGSAEGMLFSDVRTHIALVLKKHNPQIFRGDNFPEAVQTTPEQLEQIAASKSIAKVSYISEDRLTGLTHARFVTHAAYAIASLGEASLLYDLVGERLWEFKAFQETLAANPKGDQPQLHLRTLWRIVGAGSRVETRGLAKLGLPELRSPELERDQQVVAENVISEAADQIWRHGLLPESLEVEMFGDTFKVEVGKRDSKVAEVRLLRMHLA